MGIYLKRGKYFIDFYADGRRVRECVGAVSRRVAADALKARQGEVVQGRYKLQSKAAFPRFDAFSARFMEYSKAHKSFRSSTADQTRINWLLPFFKSYRLDQITPFLVEKYVHYRRQSTSRRHKAPANATINRELGVLKHMFNMALQGRRRRVTRYGVSAF